MRKLWPAATLAGAAIGVSATWSVVDDYGRWRALGPSGLSADRRGWPMTSRLRLRTRDPLAIAPLLARVADGGDTTRLAGLPHRPGDDHALRRIRSRIADSISTLHRGC